MNRLDGNTILIADTDKLYGAQLVEVLDLYGAQCFFANDLTDAKNLLLKYDFDMVISNYYLPDGIILHLIDWCSTNLSYLPIFTCTNHPMPGEIELSQKQSIAEIFSKSDFPHMLKGISRLLFDFNVFYENLLEMMAPTEIRIEAIVNKKTHILNALELTQEGMFIEPGNEFKSGAFGILKFSLSYEFKNQNFVIPGHFEKHFFKVNENYVSNWEKFLNYLNLRQVNITQFMNKAAGY